MEHSGYDSQIYPDIKPAAVAASLHLLLKQDRDYLGTLLT